jgi:hypothetical protein
VEEWSGRMERMHMEAETENELKSTLQTLYLQLKSCLARNQSFLSALTQAPSAQTVLSHDIEKSISQINKLILDIEDYLPEIKQ